MALIQDTTIFTHYNSNMNHTSLITNIKKRKIIYLNNKFSIFVKLKPKRMIGN